MIKILSRNIIRFLFLVFIQVLIFNNIQISGLINPYVYVIFILLLPFETPKLALLGLAFLLGISVDLFANTPGMHSTATVLMAFLRPYVLSIIAPRDGYETGTFPRVYYYGFFWFLKYAAILVTIHHLTLFYLEIFRLTDFFTTFFRSVISSAFSITFIVLSQYFIFRR